MKLAEHPARTAFPPGAAERWDQSQRSRDDDEALRAVQILGWELLTLYMNGGLGRSVLTFPFLASTSADLERRAGRLRRCWAELCKRHDLRRLPERSVIPVEAVLTFHYEQIGRLLARRSAGETTNPVTIPDSRARLEHPALQRTLRRLAGIREHIHSYWFHGSVGSGDVKPGWSDVDGLVVLNERALGDPAALRKARVGLLRCRSDFLDFMPYQLHGHFVLAAPDSAWHPAPMFPSVLLEHASCVVRPEAAWSLREVQDRALALRQLWEHGIEDLLRDPAHHLRSTRHKIAFLHRIYLLPCLLFQVHERPLFKREAFSRLGEILEDDEIEVVQRASRVWNEWRPPRAGVSRPLLAANLFRHNPALYQRALRRIGDRLPWLSGAPDPGWNQLTRDAQGMAQRIWHRVQLEHGVG